MTNQIIGHFIKLGYKYHRDPLGHYFDKADTRLSIMIQGPVWNCYCNKLVSGQFQLVDKQMNLLNDDFVYRWMLLHAN
jgi:hypothetical protein